MNHPSLFPAQGARPIDGVSDVAALIASRLVVFGSSGSGKSHAIARVLESARSLEDEDGVQPVQRIVLDTEDEYGHLRAAPGSDYVLIGEDGEVPLRPDAPAELAELLTETGVSAIVQLNAIDELEDRQQFVGEFVKKLMDAPKRLWRPRLLAIDEGHLYAPLRESPASLKPIVRVATQGRKRKLGLMIATQRPAELAATVRGQCSNKLIGRLEQPLDTDAACDLLGFRKTSREAAGLLDLEHDFWAMGPALTRRAEMVRFRAPSRHSAGNLPPPCEAVAPILGKLAALTADKPARRLVTPEELEAAVAAARTEAHASGLAEGLKAADEAAAARVVEALSAAFPNLAVKARRQRSASNEGGAE